jgi:ABC-type transporter Mla maintaining outer membrane lipid asymmetry ATPase subunit MlaF
MTEHPTAQAGVPAIEMTGIAVGALRDPDTMVAEGVNWTVHAGDYWVVAGLHGSGKSDFLMLTSGLMAPRLGQYRFFGEEMPIFEDARLKERLRLGLVFEGGQLFNHLTVAENVALPLRYHHNLSRSEAAAAVGELLESTELTPWADSTPGALGRSWQKRAGLARALALQPEVLLVDNPLGGLDPRHVQWWLGFLDELSKGHRLMQGRPVTLVVTAADFHPWKGHARQFATLRKQAFVALGAWGQLAAASEELVRELLTEPRQTE